ncbi:hypothetical protein [Sphingomonas sp. CARO-RG-8B-R24-01]|uniref:hypothetical protein n=1 Tax=Sphingomonas sp. CARO-RG-8B-R24-01 TaxID=2914831 RepID=UPI001F5A19DB|nr:hypothetical protein [Sphingomonas sp. CARO-RG-8B-R24-01]
MTDDTAVQARHREIAVKHVLLKLIEYVEAKHPSLLDHVESSLDRLGDPAKDDSKDDEAVREIARKLIASTRREGAV